MQWVTCTSLMWFKHSKPHRSFSNYILTKIARYRDLFHMTSGCFDCTEPSTTTSHQRNQLVHKASCIPSISHIKLHPHRDRKLQRLLSLKIGVVRIDWTFSNYTSQEREGVQGARYTGSVMFKNIEPHRTLSHCRDSKMYRLLAHKFEVVLLYEKRKL